MCPPEALLGPSLPVLINDEVIESFDVILLILCVRLGSMLFFHFLLATKG